MSIDNEYEKSLYEFSVGVTSTTYLNHAPLGLVSNTSIRGRTKGNPPPPPPRISDSNGRIGKIHTQFDSPIRELPEQGVQFDLKVIDDIAGQVKVEMFDCMYGLDETG